MIITGRYPLTFAVFFPILDNTYHIYEEKENKTQNVVSAELCIQEGMCMQKGICMREDMCRQEAAGAKKQGYRVLERNERK